MIERSLVLVKPDGVQRGIAGEVISRFEKSGMKIIAMKMFQVTPEFAKKHYPAHVEKPFYPSLEKTIIEGPVIAMVLEGVEAVEVIRKIVGSTEPKSALPGTIRGDYAHISYGRADEKGISTKNVVHASGNKEEAKYEIELWFTKEELHNYKTVHEIHITGGD